MERQGRESENLVLYRAQKSQHLELHNTMILYVHQTERSLTAFRVSDWRGRVYARMISDDSQPIHYPKSRDLEGRMSRNQEIE